MQNLKNIIFGLLKDDSKTLVFTSEIVARSWLRKYAIETECKTVFLERAISWDKFKTSFVDSGSLKQITNVERQIFANKFIKENFDKLTYFCSRYKESVAPFASAVASYLPFFAYANEKSGEALHDINFIVEGYKQYLKENGLFEYNFLPKDYSCLNKNYVLIFPEIFNDPIVDEISSLCTVLSTKEIKNKDMRILSYQNSLCEIRSVLRSIAEHLDEGEDPNEIAITCGCIDQYRSYLVSESKKLDVDLCFTSSMPITSTPQGRFFETLYKVFDNGYDFRSMKALLLDPGFPFKDASANKILVQEAIKLRLKNYPREEWIRRLQKSESLEYFTKLSNGIEAIFNAAETAKVLQSIKDFVAEFFVQDSFFFNQNGVYSQCLALLEKCNDYNLFLQIMQNETYVDSARNGVRVYKYPVSATIAAKVNYVIGLDDKNTTIRFDKYPYLPMYKKDIQELESTVKTDEVLAVYANKDFDGQVIISGTKDGFEGTRLLPISLLEEKCPVQGRNPFEEERNLWLGSKGGCKLSKTQKLGYEESKKGLLNYSSDYHFPSSDKLQNIDITASSFKEFAKCPFKGFISIYLKPNQLDLEPNFLDPRVIGNVLHHAIQNALQEAQTYENISADLIKTKLKEELKKAAKNYELGPKIYQDYLEQKYSGTLQKIAAAGSCDTLSGSTLFGNEVDFDMKHRVDGLDNVNLKGRIDTILKNFDGYVVVDYKSSNSAKDYNSNLEDTNPQVALYAQLIKDNLQDGEVLAGAYYTIDNGKMNFVWPQTSKECSIDYSNVDFDFKQKEENLRNAILSSNFPTSNDDEKCKSCQFSGICRRRFVAR